MQQEKTDIAKEIEKYLFIQTEEPKKGKILNCKIVEILDDYVIVELGLKTEGKIKKSEIEKEKLKKGQEIQAVMLGRSSDGLYKLSYKEAKEIKMREYLSELMQKRKSVIGVVVGKSKNFYEIDVGDFSGLGIGSYIAYCPFSLAEDIKVGFHYDFMIKERAQDGRWILSRKDYLQILQEEEKRRVLEQLKPGAVIEGKIILVRDAYAEIDFGGGIRGKILRDDIAWTRVESCHDFLKKGDVIKVKILETEPFIRASVKHLKGDPWAELIQKFKVGDIVEGEVSDIKNFGVFVKIKVNDSEIEALLPFSEASWGEEVKFEKGQNITASIINISPEQRKVTLSLKKILPNPYDIIERTKDKEREAIVSEIEKGAYIVDLVVEEANTKIKAILPKNEVSWFLNGEEIKLDIGEQIKVKPIAVRGKKVFVSKRKVEEDEIKILANEIKGKIFPAKVLLTPDKKDRFIIVAFPYNGKLIKGIIPQDELSGRITNYSKDEEIKAEVLGYDTKSENIILSENKAILREASGKKSGMSLSSLFDSLNNSKK